MLLCYYVEILDLKWSKFLHSINSLCYASRVPCRVLSIWRWGSGTYCTVLSHALQIRYSGSVTQFFSKLLVFGNYEWQSALSWFSHNSTTLEYSLVIFAITVVSTWVIPESLLSVIIKWFSKLLWIIIYVSNVFTSISLNHQTSGFLNRTRYLDFSVFSDIIP